MNHLEHHGVKGMKWGVRRERSKFSDTKTRKDSKKSRIDRYQKQSKKASSVVTKAMDKRPEYKKMNKDFDLYINGKLDEKSEVRMLDKMDKYETEFYNRYTTLMKMNYEDFMKRYG